MARSSKDRSCSKSASCDTLEFTVKTTTKLGFLTAVVLGLSAVACTPKPPPSTPGKIESTPLSSAKSSGRFERLSAEESGIDFVHVWNPSQGHVQDIDNAFAGGGACTGDYDGDGLADVYLTRPQQGSRLYRNLGDFRFEDVTEKAGLADSTLWGTGTSFVDIDNDGDLDLFACCFVGPNRLYVNQGDGSFREEARKRGLDFNGASVMMAFADYDLDGDVDAYLLTNRVATSHDAPLEALQVEKRGGRAVVTNGNRELKDAILKPDGKIHLFNAGQYDHLYRNNGDGTFEDVGEKAGIRGNYVGLSVTWWDYDRDGFPDLYVANDFETPDQLLHNNGDGTFTDVIKTAIPHTPWFSMGADFGDINNDGLFDFMGSDMSGSTHFKQKVSMGDMGDTGWFLTHPTPRQYMRNALYLNSGTKRFMEIAFLAGVSDTDWTWAIKFSDLDNDGWVDLFLTNGMTRDWFNSDLRKPYGENYSPLEALELWLLEPKRSEANMAFRNGGDLEFEQVGEAWGLNHEGVSFGATLADLDRDGDLDIVVNNFEEPVGVYRNDVASNRSVLVRLEGTMSNRYGLGATLVAKTAAAGIHLRHVALCRGFMSANEPIVHIGLGESKVLESLTVEWPSGFVQSFEKLEANRLYTITEPGGVPPPRKKPEAPMPLFQANASKLAVRHVEASFNDFERQPLLPNKLSQLGPGMAWGDVDGDGDEDFYLSAAAGRAGAIYFNENYERFFDRNRSRGDFDSDRDSEDMAPLFFDADGDDDLDLYVVSGGLECGPTDPVLRDRLYLNDGKGNFAKSPEGTLPDQPDSGSVVAAADFDRDGDLDLFVGGRQVPGYYPLPPSSRLLRNEGGRFVDVTKELAAGLRTMGLVTSALWSDVDNDTWLDLLITHEWGPVRLWHYENGKLVERTGVAGLGERLGWWNGIAAGDVDNDGDIDYVVTNFGLNTKYHASQDKPAMLYCGDFEKQGRIRLVEAEFEGDTVFPVRGKSCSSSAMPFLGEKYDSFKSFAAASLEDIYTPERLQKSLRITANTLESGVYINDGTGRMEFRALPRIAQAAPGFGAAITDVDGDGNADIYMTQNFYSPQPETGRMDGGVSLLLLGDGTGNFEPLMPDRSGLLVPRDAKGLTVSDLNNDSWPDFVVGINNGKTMSFENRGSENRDSKNRRMIRVRLQGRTGNPTAIGARVTLRLDDDSTRSAEVYAGGGYLSQSTSSMFFGLGTSRAVKEIQVRWPDGKITIETAPSGTKAIVVEQPDV
jgi:hypothetical protein